MPVLPKIRRHGILPRLALTSLTALALAAGGSGRARANGAFPDAQSLLTPAAWSNELILATTFGVVFSQDAGRTWLWTCEQEGNLFGVMYQISLPPRHRIYALSNNRVVFSDDMTCSWHIAGGAVTGQEIADVWVDRAVPDRLFAIGARCCDTGGTVHSIFPSLDGGQTFGPAVYVGAVGDRVTGVETSVSDPRVIYLTIEGGGTQPLLVRSGDGGASWERHDLSGLLGIGRLRLVDVDPADPDRVFLMWRDIRIGEQLVLSEDGGKTVAVTFPGDGGARVLSGFVRTASGALLLATNRNGVSGLFRSTDRGHTFVEVQNAPQLRGFSVRGEVVFAATDNFVDGYAIGTSTDDGTTWRPLLRYDQVQAIPACLRAACQTDCQTLAPLLWPPEICSADAPPPAPSSDGGTGGGGGAVEPDGSGGVGGRPASVRAGGGGCRCDVAAASGDAATRWGSLALVVLGAQAVRRRRLPPLK